jgi:ubiquinone/menaquinone biosynthesis C-methylase UbiE
MMKRVPEPELMDQDTQASAYASADFEAPHSQFIELFRETFSYLDPAGMVLDLGCGPADITLRFARAFPDSYLHGVDGARAMLNYGQQAVDAAGLDARISLIEAHLPTTTLPRSEYEVVISNSLLHHLADPMVLWRTIRQFAGVGAPVFVMDLMRPESQAEARQLQLRYAAEEPAILQQDFYHSLCAAYTPAEVEQQLVTAHLDFAVRVVSDRHFVVAGVMP